MSISSVYRQLPFRVAVQHILPRRSKVHVATLQSDATELARLNSATLGAEMPEVTLANGDKVQTGTVGALLRNISAYDELIGQLNSTNTEVRKQDLQAEVFKYESMLKAPLPLLQKVGLFSLFPPEEWVSGGSPGRKFVGCCAIEAGY